MRTHSVMTMADLLCYMRERVIKARENNNSDDFTSLFYALSVIQDAIETGPDKTYWWIVDDLENVLRHTGIAEFKVNIPSVEQIRTASPNDNSSNQA